MLKTLTLFFCALATITSYAQQTQTPIKGIDGIKLGDSINRVTTYGFPFTAVAKYRLSDTLIAKIKDEKRRGYDLWTDGGKTFCPDVSVFNTNNFNINQIQHSKKASLVLTYFKNVLIEIRIMDSTKRIRDNYSFGIKRYGKSFYKQMDGFTRLEGRYPGNNKPTEDFTKTPIATIANQLSYNAHIETLYWKNGNNSFSYNQCSAPYKFWIERYFLSDECGWCGCAEAAIIIRNDKAYEAMTDCSDKALQRLMGK
jgi:hypothetical protein